MIPSKSLLGLVFLLVIGYSGKSAVHVTLNPEAINGTSIKLVCTYPFGPHSTLASLMWEYSNDSFSDSIYKYIYNSPNKSGPRGRYIGRITNIEGPDNRHHSMILQKPNWCNDVGSYTCMVWGLDYSFDRAKGNLEADPPQPKLFLNNQEILIDMTFINSSQVKISCTTWWNSYDVEVTLFSKFGRNSSRGVLYHDCIYNATVTKSFELPQGEEYSFNCTAKHNGRNTGWLTRRLVFQGYSTTSAVNVTLNPEAINGTSIKLVCTYALGPHSTLASLMWEYRNDSLSDIIYQYNYNSPNKSGPHGRYIGRITNIEGPGTKHHSMILEKPNWCDDVGSYTCMVWGLEHPQLFETATANLKAVPTQPKLLMNNQEIPIGKTVTLSSSVKIACTTSWHTDDVEVTLSSKFGNSSSRGVLHYDCIYNATITKSFDLPRGEEYSFNCTAKHNGRNTGGVTRRLVVEGFPSTVDARVSGWETVARVSHVNSIFIILLVLCIGLVLISIRQQLRRNNHLRNSTQNRASN